MELEILTMSQRFDKGNGSSSAVLGSTKRWHSQHHGCLQRSSVLSVLCVELYASACFALQTVVDNSVAWRIETTTLASKGSTQ